MVPQGRIPDEIRIVFERRAGVRVDDLPKGWRDCQSHDDEGEAAAIGLIEPPISQSALLVHGGSGFVEGAVCKV